MLNYILSFIVLISIVVFVHEYGHYYFARGVTAFSIGFGKELFGYTDKMEPDGNFLQFLLVVM